MIVDIENKGTYLKVSSFSEEGDLIFYRRTRSGERKVYLGKMLSQRQEERAGLAIMGWYVREKG